MMTLSEKANLAKARDAFGKGTITRFGRYVRLDEDACREVLALIEGRLDGRFVRCDDGV